MSARVGNKMTTAALAKTIAFYGGAALVAFQLLGHLDTALVKHLDATFATKEDIQRIETKVDKLIDASAGRKR